MYLKILSIIALVFQAAMKIADYLNKEQERRDVREEERVANEKIIKDRADEADKIRGAGEPDDSFLRAPAERGAGGVQGVQTNLLERKGSEFGNEDGIGYADKTAQHDMGNELPEFRKPKRKVSKVFIHCSDSDQPGHDNIETIDHWHKQRGWSGIGYHYYIDKQGNIWPARDLEKIPASQAGNNKGSIAICLGGRSQFTVAQFYALEDLCHAINNEYIKADQRISFHGHCEVSCKTCPNFDYKSVLGLDENGYII